MIELVNVPVPDETEIDSEGNTIITRSYPPFRTIVTVPEAKALARIDDEDEDQLLDALCRAVNGTIEEHCGLALGDSKWQAIIRAPGETVYIPGPVVRPIPLVSVSVRDRAGESWRTINATTGYEFRVRGSHPAMPGVLDLLQPAGWLRVTYWRGWLTGSDVPTPLRQAARQLVGEHLTFREATSDVRNFEGAAGLPVAVCATLARYRLGGAR